MAFQLHEFHQRRAEATVQLLEQALDRMERLLTQQQAPGIIKPVRNTLAEESSARLLEKLRKLREHLHEFAARFGLQNHPVDIRQLLMAELSSAWVILEDCRPKRMKGFGVSFEPDLRKALDESLDVLLREVGAMHEDAQ